MAADDKHCKSAKHRHDKIGLSMAAAASVAKIKGGESGGVAYQWQAAKSENVAWRVWRRERHSVSMAIARRSLYQRHRAAAQQTRKVVIIRRSEISSSWQKNRRRLAPESRHRLSNKTG
jgi:hypothetical protein